MFVITFPECWPPSTTPPPFRCSSHAIKNREAEQHVKSNSSMHAHAHRLSRLNPENVSPLDPLQLCDWWATLLWKLRHYGSEHLLLWSVPIYLCPWFRRPPFGWTNATSGATMDSEGTSLNKGSCAVTERDDSLLTTETDAVLQVDDSLICLIPPLLGKEALWPPKGRRGGSVSQELQISWRV